MAHTNEPGEQLTCGEQVSLSPPDSARRFVTTHWSVVLAAVAEDTTQSAHALERLCSTYWYPIFAYLRRSGHEPPDAQDLTQSFFAHLLDKGRLQSVNPAKGRFRSFLIASLKNFLANEHDKRQSLKRGGQFTFLHIDAESGEERYQFEPFHEVTPDRAFERTWARATLDAVLNRLQQEFAAEGKADLYAALQVYLSGDTGAAPYAEAAAKLGLTEGAVKMAVLRLRRRFGESLRQEIAQTVSTPEEVDEEIRCLFAAVST